MPEVFFESKRLLLRSWYEADIGPLCEMNADPKVMEFFPKTLDKSEVLALYNMIISEQAERGFSLYAVEKKSDGKFIGLTGFHMANFNSDFTPAIEIAWRLKSEEWGRGYATEAARACLQYGKETLKLGEIVSFTVAINKRSENVMKKLGMTMQGEFMHPKLDPSHALAKHVLYKINLSGIRAF